MVFSFINSNNSAYKKNKVQLTLIASTNAYPPSNYIGNTNVCPHVRIKLATLRIADIPTLTYFSCYIIVQ